MGKRKRSVALIESDSDDDSNSGADIEAVTTRAYSVVGWKSKMKLRTKCLFSCTSRYFGIRYIPSNGLSPLPLGGMALAAGNVLLLQFFSKYPAIGVTLYRCVEGVPITYCS